jgi:hypothetical protein
VTTAEAVPAAAAFKRVEGPKGLLLHEFCRLKNATKKKLKTGSFDIRKPEGLKVKKI